MMPGAWSWTRDQLEGARSRAAAVLRTAPWNPLGYLSIPPAWLWPLSRRRELGIQTLRLKRLLRGEKRPESGSGHGGRRGPDFEGVWRRYRRFSGWSARLRQALPVAGLLLGLAVIVILSIAPLLLLRRAARWVRTSILDALKNDVFSTRRKEAATPGEESQVIIDRIEEMRIGAFRPWYQEPVVQVLFWILSFGTLVITESIRTGG